MRKLVVALVVLAAVLAVADVAARAWAEEELSRRAAAYYGPAATGSATIRSFPFLGRLLVDGEVAEAAITLDGIRADVLVVPRITLALEQVELDRRELLRRRIDVVDVGRGRVEARVDGASLARAAGVDARFSEGGIEVRRTVRGVEVTATARASLEGNRLRLNAVEVQGRQLPAGALSVTYEIPGAELLPCDPDIRPVAGGLVLTCTIADVPAGLLRRVEGSS